MVLDAPADRRRSDGAADDVCDDDVRQGEKRTRQMGDGGEDDDVSSCPDDGWIRWSVR